MGLTDDDRKAIVCYRIEKAFHTLKEAKDVLSLGHLSLCANRLYYSAFYMASALLINHGHSVNTHAGVLSTCISSKKANWIKTQPDF
ncbi:HEPN domain-containing protein [Duncaniella freteri]|uniref:HEPN domain-containing protein n=1 Tax=Duncaniella freteri TaxID=2530391 RepID=UPI00338D80E7